VPFGVIGVTLLGAVQQRRCHAGAAYTGCTSKGIRTVCGCCIMRQWFAAQSRLENVAGLQCSSRHSMTHASCVLVWPARGAVAGMVS
jgi:hypothetical protein